MTQLALAVVLAIATVAPKPGIGIDPATVQSAEVFELNVDVAAGDASLCPSILDVYGRLCPNAGRKYELKPVERERVLALLNAASFAPKKPAGCTTPRHAFVFKTTQGTRVVDVDFACHAVNAQPITKAVERELALFFRSSGLVRHLPAGI